MSKHIHEWALAKYYGSLKDSDPSGAELGMTVWVCICGEKKVVPPPRERLDE